MYPKIIEKLNVNNIQRLDFRDAHKLCLIDL